MAIGHWLAATKGQIGERYILGHQNLSLCEFLVLLGQVSGQRPPRIKIPYFVAWCAGAFGDLSARVTGRAPRVSLDGVRMAQQPMRYDSRRAVEGLGLPQTPLTVALEQAVHRFRENDYVKKARPRCG